VSRRGGAPLSAGSAGRDHPIKEDEGMGEPTANRVSIDLAHTKIHIVKEHKGNEYHATERAASAII